MSAKTPQVAGDKSREAIDRMTPAIDYLVMRDGEQRS
jgi:hypothetical protein